MISVTLDGNTFGFERDMTGRGYWQIMFGRCPRMFRQGSTGRHVVVPIEYGNLLTKLAIEEKKGSPNDFALYQRAPEKPKKEKNSSETKVRKHKIKGILLSTLMAGV